MVDTIKADDMEVDVPTDLKLDSDRQVSKDDTGDLDQTNGMDNVGQSVVINSGNEVRPLIGGQLTAKNLERLQSKLEQSIRDDVQISEVRRVSVEEVDQVANKVKAKVFLGLNNSFTLPVEL